MAKKIKKKIFNHSIFGWVCSTLFMLCYVPQILKTLELKQVGDVSFTMWFVQLIAYTCGGIYAIYIKKWPLIYGYWGGWLVTAYFLVLYWMYY